MAEHHQTGVAADLASPRLPNPAAQEADHATLFEAIALKGECPDCHRTALVRNGAFVHCKACHAAFVTGEFFVRRTEIAKGIMQTGDVIRL